MSFNITTSFNFIKELKRLVKKYPSLKTEIESIGKELSENPTLGTPIGKDCFKIRIGIKSKGKGKSGGGRVITCVISRKETVVLLSIYDKSEMENISEDILNKLLIDNNLG